MSVVLASLVSLLGAHSHPAWEDFGILEWSLAVLAALFVVWSIWRAVHYSVHPGEEGADHVKRIIFDGPPAEAPVSSSDTTEPPSR